MTGFGDAVATLQGTALVLGFGAAAVADLRNREVSDHLWQAMGAAGAAFGLLQYSGGALPLLLWLVVAAFAVEHLVPWDERLGPRGEALLLPLQVATYLGLLLLLGVAAAWYGIGPTAVPVGVVGLFATVLLARGLFELGILYGGADAKAVIAGGLVLPVLALPWWGGASFQGPLLGVLPFAITVLTNAAVLSLAIPIALVIVNVRRGEFSFPRGFTGYSLAVEQLPRRYVWVRDERVGEDGLAEDVETSEEDVRRRASLARDLAQRGVRRVWVSPQIPFVVLIAAGAIAGLLAGNLLLDLFRLV